MPLLVHLWLPTLFLLKLCSAADIHCTVTQLGGETRYSVPEFSATECEYWWTNSTKYVIANHKALTDKRVLRKSNQTLEIRGCSLVIHYSRSCLSEGIKRTVTCTSNCSRDDSSLEKHERHHWFVIVVVMVLLVLLVLLVLWCRIPRKPYNEGMNNGV